MESLTLGQPYNYPGPVKISWTISTDNRYIPSIYLQNLDPYGISSGYRLFDIRRVLLLASNRRHTLIILFETHAVVDIQGQNHVSLWYNHIRMCVFSHNITKYSGSIIHGHIWGNQFYGEILRNVRYFLGICSGSIMPLININQWLLPRGRLR